MFGSYIAGEDGGVPGTVGEFEPLTLSDKHFGSSDGLRRFSEYLRTFSGVLPKTSLKDFFITLVTISPSTKSSKK